MVVFPQKECERTAKSQQSKTTNWTVMKPDEAGRLSIPKRCDTDPLHLGSAKMPKIEEFHYWNLRIKAKVTLPSKSLKTLSMKVSLNWWFVMVFFSQHWDFFTIYENRFIWVTDNPLKIASHPSSWPAWFEVSTYKRGVSLSNSISIIHAWIIERNAMSTLIWRRDREEEDLQSKVQEKRNKLSLDFAR